MLQITAKDYSHRDATILDLNFLKLKHKLRNGVNRSILCCF